MTNVSLRQLHDDPRFIRTAYSVMQHMLWESAYVEGGTEEHVILTYTGTGTGAPKFRAMALRRWHDAPQRGWAQVAVVYTDGRVANENALAPAATGNEGNESFESGISTPESTGDVR